MKRSLILHLLVLASMAQAVLVVEDFETGDFSQHPWQHSGDAGWTIADSDPDAQSGLYYARSGLLERDQESILEITVYTNRVRFFTRGVGYSGDSAAFYINGALIANAVNLNHSNWSERDYILDTGWHTFKWVCRRGSSWNTVRLMLDNIRFGMDLPGHGSVEQPYLIATAEQLNAIGADSFYLDKEFRLIADIDLTGDGHVHPDNPGITTEFNRIGSPSNPFRGHFDGGGHSITHLVYHGYSSPFDRDIGLFGSIAPEGTVRSLKLLDFDFRGHYTIGGIAGRNRGLLFNCDVRGKVQATGRYGNSAGGITALNNGTIMFCDVEIEILSAWGPVGGIAATNAGGTISKSTSQCFIVCSEGNISGIARNTDSNNRGGIIRDCTVEGQFYGANNIGGISSANVRSTIVDCSSSVTIKGNRNLGGIAGFNNSYGNIIRSHSVGQIGAVYGEAGGVAGQNDNGAVVYGSYSRTHIHGLNVTDGDYINAEFTDGGLYGCGGLVGINRSRIAMSYADATVADGSWVYGLTYPSGGSRIENSFFIVTDGYEYLKDYYDTSVAVSREEFFDALFLTQAGWDFENYWSYTTYGQGLVFRWSADVTRHLADTNRDGSVDIADLTIFADNFLSRLSQNHFNQLVDFNFDGKVDLADFAILCRYWLQGDDE